MMPRFALSVAFLMSALLAPWWLTIPLGILLVSLYDSGIVLVTGGLIMDLAFGAPLAAFSGFQYLYTTLFLVFAAASWYLHRTLSE